MANKQEEVEKQICTQVEKSQEALVNKQEELETQICSQVKKSQEALANKQEEVEKQICTQIEKSQAALVNKQEELETQICTQIEKSQTALIGELKNLANDVAKLNETLVEVKTENSKVKEENTKLKETIGALKSLRNNWEKTEQGLRQQLSDVQMKLHDSNEKNRRQEDALKAQDERIEQKDGIIKDLQSTVADQEKEIDLKNTEGERLKSMNESMSDELEAIKEKYQNLGIDDNLLQAFNLYSSLSDDMKRWLYTLFPQQSFLGFVAAGLRLNNISSLWEMTKRNIFSDNLEDVDKLSKLFSILLTVYNEGSQEKIFELIEPTIGSQYDSSTSSIKEVKSSGIVSVVYLVGYKNIRDGIVHKAIISVKD